MVFNFKQLNPTVSDTYCNLSQLLEIFCLLLEKYRQLPFEIIFP